MAFGWLCVTVWLFLCRQWSWNGPHIPAVPGSYVPYDYDQNEQIEAAYLSKQAAVDLMKGDRLGVKNRYNYRVDFAGMFQQNLKPAIGTKRAIKREPLPAGQFPPLYAERLAAYEADRASCAVSAVASFTRLRPSVSDSGVVGVAGAGAGAGTGAGTGSPLPAKSSLQVCSI